MASSGHHLFLLFALAFLAVAADAWGGGRFFSSSKQATRPDAVDPDNAAAAADATTNSAPTFSRASSGGSRGYGLYGRPEESYPQAYFRRGVHHNAEKLTTTQATATTYSEPRAQQEEAGAVKAAAVAGEDAGAVPSAYADNGSGRGRPISYGMSDTRLYQNGRFYYDADTGKYGYGHESNPVRTPRAEEFGSEYGGRAGERRGRHGSVAATEKDRYEYAFVGFNGEEKQNDGFSQEYQNGFQGKQNEQQYYNP